VNDHSSSDTFTTPTVGAPLGEVALLRSQIAALEQLLDVHERTSLEQATRLEQTLREREELLTRERRSRDALIESEQRLRLALDAGRMGTWEWDIQQNRIIWSPEEERLYGLEPGTFSGSIDEYRDRIHPDDRERSLAEVQDAVARRARTHHVLHRIVQPDGEVRWLDSHARFLYAEDGTPLRLVGVSTDITDRREMEFARDRALNEVRSERARLYNVFMQAPAAIAVLEEAEHRFTVANPLYIELVGGRKVLGSTVREALPELDGQGFYELLDRVYESGEPYAARETLVRLDRRGAGVLDDVYLDFVYQPLEEEDGRVFGIMAHAVDVTAQVVARQTAELRAEELTRLTRELERSNKELDQFAYVASHDLKAPLRGIANLTQWIEEDLGDGVTGESKEHMQLLKGRVNRMEALIDGILAYSRAGRVRDRPARVDVGQLLAETVELIAPPAETEVVVAPEMPVIEAERVPLQQVFMNLIGNAIKHNRRPGARVEIRAEPDGDCYRFAVADNGPGIAPQYREKVWQIFQTLAPRDKVEGTGIGLSVVRKIVEARGGQAWLESEPEKGATFYFTWPKQQEPTS
jgi:PAS domain S-box-containing protein